MRRPPAATRQYPLFPYTAPFRSGPGSRASAPTVRGSDAPRIAARPVPQTTQRARHAMSETPKILYTLTDEAPWLATQSLLPVVQAYAATAGIAVDTRD